MGKALASFLEAQIEKSSDDRADVIERMGTAAGIDASTVNQILREDIICPPLQRLRGFARALSVSADRLMSEAEKDGCKFELSMATDPVALAQHLPTVGESKSTFIARCQTAGNSHQQCVMFFDQANLSRKSMFGMMLSKSDPFKLRSGTEYLKDIISTGTYTHPSTGQVIDVTVERMDSWVQTFNSMKAAGVDVEAVVDHSDKADDIVGYVTEMERIGDTLYAVHDMRGERGASLAEKVRNVSIMLQPDYVDGKDNHYGEAITHVAVCQQPVVPGQSEFIPMSKLTGGRSDVPILLQTETPEDDMKDETVKKLQTILDDDKLTEEQVPTRIEAKIKQLQDLQGKVTELESFKASHGKNKPKQLEPEVVNMLAKGEEGKFDMLALAGNILPDVAAALKKEFVGDAGARNAYALSSVQSGNGTEESLSSRIIAILSKNDPVELGERTGPQSLLLIRDVPGEDKSFSKDTLKEMVALSGGTPEKTEEPAHA